MYDETSGMYYDSNTGYYYNAVRLQLTNVLILLKLRLLGVRFVLRAEYRYLHVLQTRHGYVRVSFACLRPAGKSNS